ncbi:UDP-glucosyltransferase 2-like isoform X2 [Epargyreus clarus]
MKILLLLATIAGLSAVQGYHILCYHPLPSKSHDTLAKGIVMPLLRAGHKITWVTPYPAGKPKNVTIIDVSETIKVAQGLNIAKERVHGFEVAKTFATNITKVAFNDALKTALSQNQYDAVITEWFFSDVESGIAAIQKVPWILLSGIVMHSHLEDLVDRVTSIPTIPMMVNSFPIPMSFWDRVENTYSHLKTTVVDWLEYSTEVSKYEGYFKPLTQARGVVLPPYSVARRNVSVLLVNSHPSFAPARSLPPNVVDIGGYHIDEDTPPLPKDLQEILDSSPEGVVYFSMGSVLKSAGFPEQMRKDLIEVLGSIPYTVLWKFEEKLEGLPKNVHVRPWMPQTSILAHPNVKIFITHSGLLSTLEALHYGVPMLAIPVFGDQPGNADRGVRSGYAVKVDFGPDIKEELKKGLNEMFSNDRYYKTAKYISKLFRHRPVAPSKLITNYVELAIESKGAYHLRSKTNLYEWYQLWMLDQIAALIAIVITIYIVINKIIGLFKQPKVNKFHKDKKNK